MSDIVKLSEAELQRECLDRIVILREGHLYEVTKEYVQFFNNERPRQGMERRIPEENQSEGKRERAGEIISFPVLGYLRHDYRRAA